MQIGSGFSMLSGAQIAQKLPAPQISLATARSASQVAGTGDINSLLAYAKAASTQALRAKALRPVLETRVPAELLPEGYSLGDLVPVESLPPGYRAFAESLGATHVRPVAGPEQDEATFQDRALTALDAVQGRDPSYQAAKAAGQVTIRRASDLVSDLGDDPSLWQSFALYQGQAGQDYLGIGGTGGMGSVTSSAFATWRAAALATGTRVVTGGYGPGSYVATWAA